MADTVYRYVLMKNHVSILRDLEPGKILPYLYQEEIFTSDDMDEVKAEKTRKKKAEMLLQKLDRCGQDAMNVFVDALRKTQPHLAKIFEISQPDENGFGKSVIGLEVHLETGLNLNANGPVEHSHSSKTHPGTCVGVTVKGAAFTIPTDDQYWMKPSEARFMEEQADSQYVYPMKCKPHGLAILININKFQESVPVLEERLGSNKDVEVLQSLFQSLGYIVNFPTQLTKSGILKELQQTVNDINSRKGEIITHDSIVVFLMSHGENKVIFCADGEKLAVDEVRKLFNNDNCSALAGKPKLIFVQACRGKERDRGVVCQDGPKETTDEPLGQEVLPEEKKFVFDAPKRTMPCDADVLVAFSSVSGHTSYRNTGDGTRFVQTLVEVFRKEAWRQDLLSMLTIVNNEVSKQGDFGTKQVPEPVSTLRKKVYFWPR